LDRIYRIHRINTLFYPVNPVNLVNPVKMPSLCALGVFVVHSSLASASSSGLLEEIPRRVADEQRLGRMDTDKKGILVFFPSVLILFHPCLSV
jgi:hypothetical protein